MAKKSKKKVSKKKVSKKRKTIGGEYKITMDDMIAWAKKNGLNGKVHDKPRVKVLTLTASFKKEPKKNIKIETF